MPVFRKRNRIVSFRVSEEEFEMLQRVSEAQGAHSISDYARFAACRVFEQSAQPETDLRSIHGRLDELAQQVARLTVLVQG